MAKLLEYNMSKNRDKSIDTIGGIMILYMIILHIQKLSHYAPITNRYVPFLFSFMMWFFYKSGMYHKVTDMKSIVKSSIKRLLIPYIVFTLIGILFGTFITLYKSENLIDFYIGSVYQTLVMGGAFSNMPIWFLLSLFCVRIIFNHFINCNKGMEITGVSLIIAVILALYDVEKPPYLGNICLGLFFYGLGYYLKQIQFERYIFIVALALYILLYLLYPSNIDVRANHCTDGSYLGAVIAGVCAIVVINNLSRFKLSLQPLTYLGEHSMVYYLCHWVLLKQVQTYMTASPEKVFLIMCLACLVLLPIIDKMIYVAKLSWIVGERDR